MVPLPETPHGAGGGHLISRLNLTFQHTSLQRKPRNHHPGGINDPESTGQTWLFHPRSWTHTSAGEKSVLGEESLRAKGRGQAGDTGPDTRLPGTRCRAVPSRAGREPGPGHVRAPGHTLLPARLLRLPTGQRRDQGWSLLETPGPNCWQRQLLAAFLKSSGSNAGESLLHKRLANLSPPSKPILTQGSSFLAMPSFSKANFPLEKNGHRSAHGFPSPKHSHFMLQLISSEILALPAQQQWSQAEGEVMERRWCRERSSPRLRDPELPELSFATAPRGRLCPLL